MSYQLSVGTYQHPDGWYVVVTGFDGVINREMGPFETMDEADIFMDQVLEAVSKATKSSPNKVI